MTGFLKGFPRVIAASNPSAAVNIVSPPAGFVSTVGILTAALRNNSAPVFAVVDYWSGRIYITDDAATKAALQAAIGVGNPDVDLVPDSGQSGVSLAWHAQGVSWLAEAMAPLVTAAKPLISAPTIAFRGLKQVEAAGYIGLAVLDQQAAKVTLLAPGMSPQLDPISAALAAVQMTSGNSLAVDLDEKERAVFKP